MISWVTNHAKITQCRRSPLNVLGSPNEVRMRSGTATQQEGVSVCLTRPPPPPHFKLGVVYILYGSQLFDCYRSHSTRRETPVSFPGEKPWERGCRKCTKLQNVLFDKMHPCTCSKCNALFFFFKMLALHKRLNL